MLKRPVLRIPIAFKLVTITVLLLLAATIPIARESAQLFEEVSSGREGENNRGQADAKSLEVEGIFLNFIDKSKVVATLIKRYENKKEELDTLLEPSFYSDKDLVNVEVWGKDKDGKLVKENSISDESAFQSYNLSAKYLESLRETLKFPIAGVFGGNIEIKNSSIAGGMPLVTVGFPFMTNEETGMISHVVIADIRIDRLQKIFSGVSERTIFLFDKDGVVLAHPDEKFVLEARKLVNYGIVTEAIESKIRQKQTRFTNPDNGQDYVGSFARNALGLTVVAMAPEAIILEPAQKVKREAYRLMGYVLSGSLFLIFMFSISLTTPIERLLSITKEIAKGNFDVHAGWQIRSSDEVGELAKAFDGMTEGLKERDKVKNMFNKFHGSSVTEDLLKGSAGLGGSNKEVTVFFSDIRDFTKFSEGHTPEQVVEMLNEYFAIMVRIINEGGGVVDKFVGDAIMAVWGAPKSSGNDPHNACMAAIKMRSALAELNEKRMQRGKIPIKIGMGIHSGRAISGTIGSDERMEYTVIGDTVNMASRIESSTKSFGTDLLVSEVTSGLLEDKMIFEYAGSAEVKGKSEPLKMFKVRGYKENGIEKLVQTPYSDYEAGHDAKVKIA